MTTESFETYRPLLFSIAYRMLGSAMDAEDMVQETWLRYQRAGQESIENTRAYLCTIVTRLCINQLNSARMQRESYIGPWLPEPILTDGAALQPAPARHINRLDSISMAFLMLLERLSPAERAVFLLREVFEYDYAEIAEMVGKSEAACRQLFSRARRHVQAHQPRFESSPAAHEKLVNGFLAATETGDVEGLKQLLAEDVVLWADGGGQQGAALNPIAGRENVARFIFGSQRFAPGPLKAEVLPINGKPSIVLRGPAGQIFLIIDIDILNDHIQEFHIIGNPDKLRHL